MQHELPQGHRPEEGSPFSHGLVKVVSLPSWAIPNNYHLLFIIKTPLLQLLQHEEKAPRKDGSRKCDQDLLIFFFEWIIKGAGTWAILYSLSAEE